MQGTSGARARFAAAIDMCRQIAVMTTSHHVPYNPSLRTVGLYLGFAFFTFALAWLGVRSRTCFAFSAIFFCFSTMFFLRRVLWPRQLTLNEDSIIVPSGFLCLRHVCVPFTDIKHVSFVQFAFVRVVLVRTEKRQYQIQDLFLPDRLVFEELAAFLEAVANKQGMVSEQWATISAMLPFRQRGNSSIPIADAFWQKLRAVASVVGYESGLMVGMMGHVALFSGLVTAHRNRWVFVIVPVVALPVLVVSLLTRLKPPVLKPPLVTPRVYCGLLLLAMGWYALETLVAEVLFYCNALPPDGPRFARNLARVLMHVGWIGFIPLTMLYMSIRSAMQTQAAELSAGPQTIVGPD